MAPQDLIVSSFRLKPAQKAALSRLGLNTLADLLFYLPVRYGEQAAGKTIADLKPGEVAAITGQIVKTKAGRAWRKKIPMSEAVIDDGTGRVKAVWFHQIYMVKKFTEGSFVTVQGKVSDRRGQLYFSNPEINFAADPLTPGPTDGTGIKPIYPETRGLSSLWLYHANQKLIEAGVHLKIADPIPAEILKRYNLPSLGSALVWIHSPQKIKSAEAARKRFSFSEVFFIQLERGLARAEYRSHQATPVQIDRQSVRDFLSRLPYPPTADQEKAIDQILDDLARGEPMTRLLEGDVGSGKTLVAAATAAAVVAGRGEVAYMAPTEILARQHFVSFIKFFNHLPIQVGLITGAGCFKFPSKLNPGGYTNISRPQLLKWVATGQIPILVGTHALIQKAVKFKNLVYVVIDEQHRFGVKQRAALAQKTGAVLGRAPHLLSMTATPIPRTLALTIYGDLDLTLLKEKPPGRQRIITEIVKEENRAQAYEKMRSELRNGRQAFVICPRIDAPDPTRELALNVKSAKEEAKMLETKVFPEHSIAVLHSKLKPKEKEEIMAAFVAGKIDILVSTSVVEVGVNVENATVILIEGAERFGLAQLHQLRGRVQRSSYQSYCFVAATNESRLALARLREFAAADDGFALAELDLARRGSGSLGGGKQWGLSDLGMEAIKNLKLVEAARTEAQALLAADPDLHNWPEIKKRLATNHPNLHLE